MPDRTPEHDEDLASTLVTTLKNNQLAHLYDILHDNCHQLGYYYGENAGGFTNVDSYARNLARNFKFPITEFLHRVSNDFTRSQRNRRALDDLLIEYGMDAETIEAYDSSYTDYLLMLYHHFYDSSEQDLPNYQYLAAKTLHFKDQSGLTLASGRRMPHGRMCATPCVDHWTMALRRRDEIQGVAQVSVEAAVLSISSFWRFGECCSCSDYVEIRQDRDFWGIMGNHHDHHQYLRDHGFL